jgi:hypothetical protein
MSLDAPASRALTRDTRRLPDLVWGFVSVLVVALAPVVLHQVFRWDHAVNYRGTCGPLVPGDKALYCSYADYMAEFGDGIVGGGQWIMEALAFVLAALLVSALWAIAAWKTRSRSTIPGEGHPARQDIVAGNGNHRV